MIEIGEVHPFIGHNDIIKTIKKVDRNVGVEGRKLNKYSKEFKLSAVEAKSFLDGKGFDIEHMLKRS